MKRTIVTLMDSRDLYQTNRALLRTPCLNVDEITEDVERVAQDLIDTILETGGIGLAANQIGETYRMIAVFDETLEDPVILINPVFTPDEAGGKISRPEGCLSLPGVTAEVRRWKYGQLIAMKLDGKEYTYQLPYHVGRVVQHEIDHLNGILMTDVADSYSNLSGVHQKSWVTAG